MHEEITTPYTMKILESFTAIILSKPIAEKLVKGEKESKARESLAIQQLEIDRGKKYGT
jgi:hypothetical protein